VEPISEAAHDETVSPVSEVHIGKLTGSLQTIVNPLQGIANSEMPEMPIIFQVPITITQNKQTNEKLGDNPQTSFHAL
jgi:hypothetical protein